jgi:hypothetical protein
MEKEGMHEQPGLRANKGTDDGLFATSMGLQKKIQVQFFDLIKAFDILPREAPFEVLYDAAA